MEAMASRGPPSTPAVWGWREGASGRLLGSAALTSTAVAVAVAVALLGGAWLVAWAAGGTSVAAPHWFYIPILFGAARFGIPGALATSISATILAGPLLSSDTDTGAVQPLSDWTTRGGFFVGLGFLMALCLYERRPIHESRLVALRVDRRLRRALVGGELRVAYQPIYDIRGDDCRIVGVEALVRWPGAPGACRSPAHLIQVAETTGRIHDLGDFVMRVAAAQASEWRTLMGAETFFVGVNVSARQLAAGDFVERLCACLRDTDVGFADLYLEITETAFLGDVPLGERQLRELHDLGCHLAVDDFGTGYSSLAYVHRYPIDVIKIDRYFVERVAMDTEAASIVETLVHLTHALGNWTIAEGVETPEQLEKLRMMGCDFAQGYLLARPGPAEQVSTLLEAQRSARRRTEDVTRS
jgi:EAL domain-containing protein (putative c-di-GMP-specific phosphodiesterase class I)